VREEPEIRIESEGIVDDLRVSDGSLKSRRQEV